MRLFLLVIAMLIHINCYSQKIDTLLEKKHVTLQLNNGFAIPPFGVSGDLYLLNDQFVFKPKPFRKKKYEQYNDLVKEITLPYDSILLAKRVGISGLKIKTKT